MNQIYGELEDEDLRRNRPSKIWNAQEGWFEDEFPVQPQKNVGVRAMWEWIGYDRILIPIAPRDWNIYLLIYNRFKPFM